MKNQSIQLKIDQLTEWWRDQHLFRPPRFFEGAVRPLSAIVGDCQVAVLLLDDNGGSTTWVGNSEPDDEGTVLKIEHRDGHVDITVRLAVADLVETTNR